jgi:hypothetical protein
MNLDEPKVGPDFSPQVGIAPSKLQLARHSEITELSATVWSSAHTTDRPLWR